MAVLQSTLYWGFVGITSILVFPIALILRILTQPFDKRLRLVHWFTSIWASTYTWISPWWHVRVENREHIDNSTHYVMVSNHQSMVDIMVMFRILAHFKWVSKAENFKIPFVGWNMRLNRYIAIDRGSVKAGGKMMKDCERTLSEGSSVMIFPEGTRSETGELRAFKRGAFELAMQSGAPVLPIVIEGSSRALPKKGVVIRGSHRIRVKILEPIRSEVFATAQELCDHVRTVIAEELVTMRSVLQQTQSGPLAG